MIAIRFPPEYSSVALKELEHLDNLNFLFDFTSSRNDECKYVAIDCIVNVLLEHQVKESDIKRLITLFNSLECNERKSSIISVLSKCCKQFPFIVAEFLRSHAQTFPLESESVKVAMTQAAFILTSIKEFNEFARHFILLAESDSSYTLNAIAKVFSFSLDPAFEFTCTSCNSFLDVSMYLFPTPTVHISKDSAVSEESEELKASTELTHSEEPEEFEDSGQPEDLDSFYE